jgi:peptide/nickel transport system ATP-binding protein
VSAVLAVENLSVDIPLAAGMLHPVRGVSFQVRRGETLAIVGESGCGKSLTALAIMGLLPKSAERRAHRLEFAGQSLLELSERAMADIRGDRIGMIFQDPMTSLNPAFTIGNQLEEALLRHRKVTRRQARDRAVFLLEKVGITAAESRLRQYPHQLSGGLRQRVMIAMALMCDPALILADEPTTALDVTIQAQILLLLASLQKEFEMGGILITHDLGVVARVADRVAVMYAGEIVESGTAAEIFSGPLHPYTQGLLECIPIPGKTRPGEHLGSIPGIVPNLIGDLRGCAFRDRCAYAYDACGEEDVAPRKLGPGRSFRCLLPEQVEKRRPTRPEWLEPRQAAAS